MLGTNHLISESFHHFENSELLLRSNHNEFGCWVHVQSSPEPEILRSDN